MHERSATVLSTGPLATLQDLGRCGWAHLGVPRSGAADLNAHVLANRLVGNLSTAPTVEITAGGFAMRMHSAATVALTGAVAPLRVDGVERGWATPLSVHAGEVVEVGTFTTGLRGYLAISGGPIAVPVLGSVATDSLSGIGPPALQEDDLLRFGPVRGTPVEAIGVVPRIEGPLRLTWGPRTDWITEAARERLLMSSYVVLPDSNRVAVRLHGPPMTWQIKRELPSEGVVLGGVQVPPNGRPLIFLADHPVTGGYPVVAVVHPADLALAAQRRPGDTVEFTLAVG